MAAPTNHPSQSKQIMKVSRRTIYSNLVLSVFKLAAGIIAHSSAMISDAVHSASDVFSTLIVMIGVRISGRKADGNHHYGHERMEAVATILLAAVLTATGIGIGYSGVRSILAASFHHLPIPGLLAMIAAVFSIIVKEAMFWYTHHTAKKLQSAALMADAWHHRSDALSSIGSLIGIAGARLGTPVLDPIASLIICLFIMKAAYDIFMSAVRQLVDQSAEPEVEAAMAELILQQSGVLQLDLLRSRQFGNRLYLDVEISADGGLPLYDAHIIADRVHDEVEAAFPAVKHCMVHVNPLEPSSLSNDGPAQPVIAAVPLERDHLTL